MADWSRMDVETMTSCGTDLLWMHVQIHETYDWRKAILPWQTLWRKSAAHLP